MRDDLRRLRPFSKPLIAARLRAGDVVLTTSAPMEVLEVQQAPPSPACPDGGITALVYEQGLGQRKITWRIGAELKHVATLGAQAEYRHWMSQ